MVPRTTLVFTTFSLLAVSEAAFTTSHRRQRESTTHRSLLLNENVSNLDTATPEKRWSPQQNRRQLLLGSLLLQLPGMSSVADADDTDLTSRLFNPDGSIKEDAGLETEAKFRTVAITWNSGSGTSNSNLIQAIDGQVQENKNNDGPATTLSYRLPEKWGKNNSNIYFDTAQGATACNRILVYQAPDIATERRLEKATTVGIAKALDVPADLLPDLRRADLIGGRTAVRDGQKYFDFDMALAPEACESSKEDLGLGFCPYESIYLLSSTVLNEKLYVLALQCDKSEWKRANSDLRQVRSSFSVELS